MIKSRLPLLLVLLSPLLFWSCATSRQAGQVADPVAVLSYSSEGAAPAVFAVIPSAFILPALEEIKMSASAEENAPAAEFLVEFFSRAECVFASIMRSDASDALFCRVLAFGKFPARTFRLALNSSRGWERREENGAVWFDGQGGAIRVAIPASKMLLAEIDIASPTAKRVGDGASSSMADFIAAAALNLAAPDFADAGEMFFAAVDGAVLGAANVPFAFFAPDFNSFVRSVLPAAPAFPLAGVAAALSAFDGFSLPISSIELAVDKGAGEPAEDGASFELLTVRAAVSSSALMRAATLLVQLMFPDESVTAENGLITVVKEIPAGSAALAVLSFFLLS